MHRAPIEDTAVVVLTKAPIAGYAKTRLIPLLGAKGAADAQRVLILKTIRMVLGSPFRSASLWCAPDRSHEMFQAMRRSFGIDTFDQVGDDLGARMLQAFTGLATNRPVLLIGTDCPILSAEHLRLCDAALRNGADAAIVPAEDGGYALIGLRRPVPELFTGIAWGSDAVMQQTRERLHRLRLHHFETEAVWDVDTPADYARACSERLLDDGLDSASP